MSPARRHRGVTGQDRRQAHIDWLKLIEVSGPFLSVPVLTAEWPDLEPLDSKDRDRLRQEHRQWQERPAAHRDDWISYVLDDLLGWQGAVQRDDLARLTLDVPEHETAITPSFTLTDPATGDLRLLGLVSDDSPVARIKGSDWPATPADRLAQLCRHHGVELGLATDGRWWALVWAPAGGVTTVAVFDAISWPDLSERTVLRAFISLLQRRRFFAVPPERQLPALLRESLNNQEEITDRLGVQVRQAVELLVAAFGRADISADVTAYEVYRGAVAVMMRLVFLLFAEESGLLPADNELYARAYSAGGLYAELEQRVADARGNEGELEHTFLAWHRLLALFTVVYRGVVPPRARPDRPRRLAVRPGRHPWLPLTVDDRTVLHMLRAVQTVTIAGELRTVSFRTLTVEQIGYVYEGLLSFEGFRAAETVVGLIGKDGREEEVPLADAGEHRRGARFRGNARRQARRTLQGLRHRLPPSADRQARPAHRRRAGPGRDPAVRRHPGPRPGPAPAAVLPDHPPGPARRPGGDPARRPVRHRVRAAGQHRHPLHAQVPRRAGRRRRPGTPRLLPGPAADRRPLRSGSSAPPRRSWPCGSPTSRWAPAPSSSPPAATWPASSSKPGPPTGNVDARRILAEPPVESGLALDVAADPLVIKARREIIEHCLYGVDINEMAVEMAKLSLWLVSMDPHRPFTFLDDRLAVGDSLLGITSHRAARMDAPRPEGGPQAPRGRRCSTSCPASARCSPRSPSSASAWSTSPTTPSPTSPRNARSWPTSRRRPSDLTRYADLIVGAALASSGKGGLWLTAAKLANEAATEGAVEEAEEQAKKWLATDQPDGAFDRHPLHWPLVFPEVFDPPARTAPASTP